MARFSVNDADKYGGNGGGGFFSLKNDKDVAKVRFLYDSINDVEGLAVHQIEVDGKKRYVNCLRDYGQPMDVCPFCREKKFVTAKYFIPLYNLDDDQVQIWERGKQFGAKLSSLCGRYPNLVSQVFEIERNGKKGDTNTTYEIYPTGQPDDTRVEDYELPQVLGGLVFDKSAEDMEYFMDYGEFPEDSSSDNSSRSDEREVPRRRGGQDEDVPRRRTPARRGDAF